MKIDFHDARVNDPIGPKMNSPTHAGVVHVDCEYQAEQVVIEAEVDYPFIIRIVLDDGRREWHRVDGKFIEDPR